jgi:hypothetical protein
MRSYHSGLGVALVSVHKALSTKKKKKILLRIGDFC